LVTVFGYTLLLVGWLVWMFPFLRVRRKTGKAARIDRRARWGIVLVGVGFGLMWQRRAWDEPPTPLGIAGSVLFLVLASVLSWSATRVLGRQWRIDAGLNADHELVTAGPYQVVRHPIYTSMLCVLLASGFMINQHWPLMVVSLLLYFIGTEIRVRVEDGLLASRFGATFLEYQRRVSAYIPFVR